MDVGGVWGEGNRGGVAVVDGIFFGKGKGWGLGCSVGWYLGFGVGMFWLLLLLLRVGIVRIIILMYSYYQSA